MPDEMTDTDAHNHNPLCVACGRRIMLGTAPLASVPMHPGCYDIAVEAIFSGRYDALTGEEIKAVIKIRALKESV